MSTLHMPGCKPILLRQSSASQRKERREMRRHAKRMDAAGCPEKAAIWRRRARNG
jgi:hypothetical protein